MEGNVNLQTGGGNIKVASAKGEIKAESGGGSVVVLSGLQGAVLETGGGSIRVEKCSGPVKATTGGGSIDLGDIGGAAQIETGGGQHSAGFGERPRAGRDGRRQYRIEWRALGAGGNFGGRNHREAALILGAAARNNSSLETSAGDITVYLANDLAISIRAEIEIANGHTIRSDFSDIHVSSEGGLWAENGDGRGSTQRWRPGVEGPDEFWECQFPPRQPVGHMVVGHGSSGSPVKAGRGYARRLTLTDLDGVVGIREGL